MVLCVLFYQFATAQNISAGLKAGLSLRNFANGRGVSHLISPDNHLNISTEAAVFVDFPLSGVLSFQPMIEYSAQGSKHGIFYPTIENGGASGKSFNKAAQLNYLMLPLLAKLSWNINGPKLKFYADAGPFASYLLTATQAYTSDAEPNPLNLPQTYYYQNVRSQLKPYNAGVEANIGLRFAGDKNSFFLEAGANYGLINIQRDATNGINYTGAINFAIGYMYRFGLPDPRLAEHFYPFRSQPSYR